MISKGFSLLNRVEEHRGGGTATSLGKRQVFSTRCRLVLVSCLAAALPILSHAQTVVSTLDEPHLIAAMQNGGTITFAASGTILLTNTITNSTSVVLDGTNQSIGISGGGTVQLFNVAAGLSFTLRNLTLSNGLAHNEGGAIYTQGNLNIINCTFSSNTVFGGLITNSNNELACGGAIFNSGTLAVTNSWFVRNSAVGAINITGSSSVSASGGSANGGAIFNDGGAMYMGGTSFSNNTATGGSAGGSSINGSGAGGAVYASGGVIEADGLLFANNTVAGGHSTPVTFEVAGAEYGGALYLTSATVVISNSSFISNSSAGPVAPTDGPYFPGPSEGGVRFQQLRLRSLLPMQLCSKYRQRRYRRVIFLIVPPVGRTWWSDL